MRRRNVDITTFVGLMSPTEITGWVELIKSLGIGLTVSALAVIWFLYKGVLVWGTYYEATRREREEWKNAALSGTGVLEKLVERIEKKQL